MQGVGFRPFVYRLASELQLTGWVINDSRGVTIEVQGAQRSLDEFVRRLQEELPPLAEIGSCEVGEPDVQVDENRFEIRPSEGGELTDAQVTVDTATCPDCLRELNDPTDPRYHYPFINCTNCGARYTIVKRIPYDRPNTTMSNFAMCSLCASQYGDPADRRFHAQPVACPSCGPTVWLVDTRGKQIICDDPIAETAKMLRAGGIVAIKGLGGFHLAARADDGHVLNRLRERKHRDAKPFALMVGDMQQARELCEVSDEAEKLLTGALRPIVLLPRLPDAPAAPQVAEGLKTLGIMLPYTPLHHLLFTHGLPPLVMTSGNHSEEPLVKDNDAAVAHLGRIADAILLHNRGIARRVDDSVVQLHDDGQLSVLRRARGYAPRPVQFGTGGAGSGISVLAVGAELKNTFCLFKDGRAVVSEHIGDLKDGRTYRHFIDTINHLEDLFEFTPDVIAADMHPQYLSTEYAMRRHRGELPGREAIPIVRVQHHHAHVVSCMVENARTDPVLGLVCDGVGYGDDGAVWGCEVLRAELGDYERIGHLRYVPLIGGDAAAAETWRPALAALHEVFGSDCARIVGDIPLEITDDQLQGGLEQLAVDVNCPPSSSLGRWFDAVAGLTGIAGENLCEAHAAMLLEAIAHEGVEDAYPFRIVSEGPFLIDLRPMVESMVGDLRVGAEVGYVSAKFHNTVARFLVASAIRARRETSLDTVALSGGCFANRYLTSRLVEKLAAEGFEVLRHRRVPCNDGGLSLGEAVVGAVRKSAAMEPESLRMHPDRSSRHGERG